MTNPHPGDSVPSPRASLHYLPGIDGLRAVSVLAVLVYHHYALGASTPGWLPGGFMGVEVFFVVSGYLITALLLDEQRRNGAISLRRFWYRRARRLLPALFALLAVVIVLSLLVVRDALGTLRGDVVSALTYTNNWWQIVDSRSYFEDAARPPLLKHLWSLAIEEQFYLFWPIVLAAGLRRTTRARLVLVIVGVALASALAMAVLYSGGDASTVYYATPTRLSGLLLGAALAFVWTPRRLQGTTGRGARTVLNLAGLLGAVVLLHSFRYMHDFDASVYRGGFLLVGVATVLVIAAAVHPRSDLDRVLGWRPLQRLGLRSYGIYLWHFPVFAVTRRDDLRTSIGFMPPGILWIALRVGLTLVLAELSFRVVETPIRAGAVGRYLDRLRTARGATRRRLATRGLATGLAVSLTAVVLGSGLANAQPQAGKVHGIDNRDVEEEKEGDAPDPDALEELTNIVTTTTAAVAASTTTLPGGTVDTTPVTDAPPPTDPPPPPAVLGIGDSVMLGAKGELQATVSGMVVDAIVSRQFAHAIAVLEFYRDSGVLPNVVVVHLGTNGRFGDGEFDHMMSVVGAEREVLFLTARMPRVWEGDVNAKLTAGVSRHANARLLDWRQYSGCHHDWFGTDGFHVTAVGAQNYAAFVNAHVTARGAGLTYCE